MSKEKKQPEEDAVQLHSILPPDEPEVPEEGFVPYCADAKSDGDKRLGRKAVILIVLAALLVLVPVFVFTARRLNFFHKTINQLAFDYREGETADENHAEQFGGYSLKISEQMKDKQVSVSAVTYSFNDKGGMFTDVASYDYTKNGAESVLDVCIGSEKSLFSKKMTLRNNGSRTEMKKGSGWEADNDAYVPPLSDFFFGTKNHGDISFECCDGYETVVGKTNYNCEIWLMQAGSDSNAEYYTLYRYFDGGKLAAVRVLVSTDTLMDVYDIRSYSFS